MKLYITCVKESTAWLCYGILSNGFYFGQHLCSDPSYALGDLYAHRPQRVEALHKIFGVDPKTVEWMLYRCESENDLPPWWDSPEHQAAQETLQPEYKEYAKLMGYVEEETDLPTSAHDFHD